MTDELFNEIWRLSKILKGIDRPYYITVGDDDRVLFQYPPGYKETLEKKIQKLQEEWIQKHPYDLLNGD